MSDKLPIEEIIDTSNPTTALIRQQKKSLDAKDKRIAELKKEVERLKLAFKVVEDYANESMNKIIIANNALTSVHAADDMCKIASEAIIKLKEKK